MSIAFFITSKYNLTPKGIKVMELSTSVQYLKGVGPHLAKILEKKGITTLEDLLQTYPRSYRDYRACQSIRDLKEGEDVSLAAYVTSVNFYRSQRIWDIILRDHSGHISCKYFKQPYRGYFERFYPDMKVRVEGRVSAYKWRKEFHHPDILDYAEKENLNQIVPLYPDMDPINQKKMLKMIETALQALQGKIPDILPEWLRQKYHLLLKETALQHLHQPKNLMAETLISGKSDAHRRIKFEEFFWIQLIALARKSIGPQRKSFIINKETKHLQEKVLKILNLSLTSSQIQVLSEIQQDLNLSRPMHRLIQGDVGSGKTIVAFLAALHTIANGYQVAFMVPTEVLAEQHYQNAKKLFSQLGIYVTLLTGHLKKSEREEKLLKIQSAEIQLCIGTHALIQDNVKFKNLALSIVDEQHRFGVHQRRQLKIKGSHLLVMTATPIPRSLSLTLYGDLDVSIINQLPSGRQPIVTRMVKEHQRRKVIEFIRHQLKQGRQTYIIYPLVEESEKRDFLKDAVSEFEVLQKEFQEFSLGLIHGKLKSSEKEAIMNSFRKNEIQVLVSTTVIEVGMDVSNANLILIEHAECFGLSQLHQLRGRVGRGSYKSYCILMLGKRVSRESIDRIHILEQTSDGFQIADKDLEIRGPGDALGTRQSGLEGFKMANIVRDKDILLQAHRAVQELFQKDPPLSHKEHRELKNELSRKDGLFALATSG